MLQTSLTYSCPNLFIIHADRVGVSRTFSSDCLSVCPERNSNTMIPKCPSLVWGGMTLGCPKNNNALFVGYQLCTRLPVLKIALRTAQVAGLL